MTQLALRSLCPEHFSPNRPTRPIQSNMYVCMVERFGVSRMKKSHIRSGPPYLGKPQGMKSSSTLDFCCGFPYGPSQTVAKCIPYHRCRHSEEYLDP